MLRQLGWRAMVLAAGIGVAAPARAQTPTEAAIRLEVRGDRLAPRVLTAIDLSRLPRLEVQAAEHGRAGRFAGAAVPLRLVVPHDRRPTRWVRQVTALSIRSAEP